MRFDKLEDLYREYNIILTSKYATQKDRMYANRCITTHGFAQGFRQFADIFLHIERYIDSLTRERVIELRAKLDKIADFPSNIITYNMIDFMLLYDTIFSMTDPSSEFMSTDIEDVSAVFGKLREISANITSDKKKEIIESLFSKFA
jgi:hypothetical protein